MVQKRVVGSPKLAPSESVSATGTKLEHLFALEAQTNETVRQLLVELGGSRGLEELAARGAAAHLERELGLGSLERVELMLRLGNTCGVRLPDRVVAEADTVKAALLEQLPKGELAPVVTGDLPLSPKAQRAINGAIVKAQAMREPRVSTRFLLMSLIDESGTAICKALDKAGTDVDALQPKLAEKPIAVET